MNTLEIQRRFYARYVTAKAGVTDPAVIDAFATIRRERFLGQGPWQVRVKDGYLSTQTDDPVVLYQDILVGLDATRAINNGEPSLHAASIAAAAPKPGEVVIHVGAGTGYYTALLAHIVGTTGRVHAFEIDDDLATRASRNLADFAFISVHAQSGIEATLPSADIIYVSAGATHVPEVWLKSLNIGGRLVIPLTPNERLGCMLLATRRSEGVFAARIFYSAAFIPCIGARDDEQSRILTAALDTHSQDKVRSLRLGNTADTTAWCVGSGWWLSTAEPEPLPELQTSL